MELELQAEEVQRFRNNEIVLLYVELTRTWPDSLVRLHCTVRAYSLASVGVSAKFSRWSQLRGTTAAADCVACLRCKTLNCFAMADNLLLFYLIEGTTQPSYISVSYNPNGKLVKVDDLRKTIFEDDCKHLAANHKNLTLLKVRHLLVILPYPLSL